MAYADYQKTIELEPDIQHAKRELTVIQSSREGYVLLGVYKTEGASVDDKTVIRLNPDERAELILALLEAP